MNCTVVQSLAKCTILMWFTTLAVYMHSALWLVHNSDILYTNGAWECIQTPVSIDVGVSKPNKTPLHCFLYSVWRYPSWNGTNPSTYVAACLVLLLWWMLVSSLFPRTTCHVFTQHSFSHIKQFVYKANCQSCIFYCTRYMSFVSGGWLYRKHDLYVHVSGLTMCW